MSDIKFRSEALRKTSIALQAEKLTEWTRKAREASPHKDFSEKDINKVLMDSGCKRWTDRSTWSKVIGKSANRNLSSEALLSITEHFSQIADLDVRMNDQHRLEFFSPGTRLSHFLLREIDLNRESTLWAEVSRTGSQNVASAEIIGLILIAVEWFGLKVNLVCRTKSYTLANLILAARKLAAEDDFTWESVQNASRLIESHIRKQEAAGKGKTKLEPLAVGPIRRADFDWFSRFFSKYNSTIRRGEPWYDFLTSSPISYFWLEKGSEGTAYFSLSENNFVREPLANSANHKELIRRYELVKNESLFTQPDSETHWQNYAEFKSKITSKAAEKGVLFG